MNKKSSLSSKKSSENQESRRRTHSNHPRNVASQPAGRTQQRAPGPRIRHSRTPLNPPVPSSIVPLRSRSRATQPANSNTTAPPARRTQQRASRPRIRRSRTPLNPPDPSSLVPLGSRSRAIQQTNSNTTFPRDFSPPRPSTFRRLVRLADVIRPTNSTEVEYRTFLGNGQLSDTRWQRIDVESYGGYEALVQYLHGLAGGRINASLEDGESGSGVSVYRATIFYTTYQDHLRRPMKRMLCRSNWVFFYKSAYKIKIRWLPFGPHLPR